MKFLSETVENNLLIEEKLDEATGQKNLYITGPFMSYDTPNRNNRVYSKAILEKEANRYIKEVVEKKQAWMEMGHPDNLGINPERICGRIVEMWDDPAQKAYMGKAIVASNTPMGALLKGILETGGAFGVSTRGAGTVKLGKNGINEVQDDLRIVAVDAVLNPSGINCFINPIMEAKEFALVEGQLVEVDEATEKAILAKHGVDIDDTDLPKKMTEAEILAKMEENSVKVMKEANADHQTYVYHHAKIKQASEQLSKLSKASPSIKKSGFDNHGEILETLEHHVKEAKRLHATIKNKKSDLSEENKTNLGDLVKTLHDHLHTAHAMSKNAYMKDKIEKHLAKHDIKHATEFGNKFKGKTALKDYATDFQDHLFSGKLD